MFAVPSCLYGYFPTPNPETPPSRRTTALRVAGARVDDRRGRAVCCGGAVGAVSGRVPRAAARVVCGDRCGGRGVAAGAGAGRLGLPAGGAGGPRELDRPGGRGCRRQALLAAPGGRPAGGLPQSPSRLRPDRHPVRALQRRAYVLGRMRALTAGTVVQDRAAAFGEAARGATLLWHPLAGTGRTAVTCAAADGAADQVTVVIE